MPGGGTAGGSARTYRVASATFGKRTYSTLAVELAVTAGPGGSNSATYHYSPLTLTRPVAHDTPDVFRLYHKNRGLGDVTVAALDAAGRVIMTLNLKGPSSIARYAHYEEGGQLIEEISITYDDITIS